MCVDGRFSKIRSHIYKGPAYYGFIMVCCSPIYYAGIHSLHLSVYVLLESFEFEKALNFKFIIALQYSNAYNNYIYFTT